MMSIFLVCDLSLSLSLFYLEFQRFLCVRCVLSFVLCCLDSSLIWGVSIYSLIYSFLNIGIKGLWAVIIVNLRAPIKGLLSLVTAHFTANAFFQFGYIFFPCLFSSANEEF